MARQIGLFWAPDRVRKELVSISGGSRLGAGPRGRVSVLGANFYIDPSRDKLIQRRAVDIYSEEAFDNGWKVALGE